MTINLSQSKPLSIVGVQILQSMQNSSRLNKGLNVWTLSQSILVYNAIGALNKREAITDYVILCMTIGSHSEHIMFGVTDLGKSDLFLSHEWLQFHKPTNNLQGCNLKFNHCPKACHLYFIFTEPEEEENLGVVEIFPIGELKGHFLWQQLYKYN